MMRHLKYLSYVLRHKWFVFLACLHLRVPLWIGIFHDWDKFLPDEWFPYARCFYKPNGEKQYNETPEFAHAWLLHQHRNKHHWQFWLWVDIPSHNYAIRLPDSDYLVWDRGTAQRVIKFNSGAEDRYELRDPYPSDSVCCPNPMPDIYRREMLADWIGAGRALGKPETWVWYEANKEKMQLHPETRAWIEDKLKELKELDRLDKMFKMGLFG